MINSLIELSKVCDIKAVQVDANNCIVQSYLDVKNYFIKNNFEISDKLALELFERLNGKELTTDQLSNISAGTVYENASRDYCPICGRTSLTSPHMGKSYALKYVSTGETICGDVYKTYQCINCQHIFYYWPESNIWEDDD